MRQILVAHFLVALEPPRRQDHTALRAQGDRLAVATGEDAPTYNQVDEAKVRAMLSAVAGVTSVEAGENEGSGTAGFVLRYSGADVRRSLFEAAVSNELILLELKQQRVTLEESFRKLTTTEARA